MGSAKTYVGKGRIKTFTNGGSIIRVGIRPEQLTANEKGYCNLCIAEMKEPDKYGNTHTVYLDDWKPTGQSRAARNAEGSGMGAGGDIDDLPF